LAPKLWATNETQSLEVEYEGKHYRGIWLPYNEDLYVHYIFDITEAKKVEKTLKESLHEMEILTEKLRVVGGLTRHDVGNKLAAIGANEFLLRKRIKDKPEFTQYLDGIKTAITSSCELFEFSRIYEQIGMKELEKIDVFECFNSAVALFSNLNAVKVINECQSLQVIADSLLIQLFYNLIDNSLKHGKKVTQIRLYSKIDSCLEKIVYEDNGVGVPEVNKLRLFEVGFTTGNGSGFGLPLIKRMIEVYGWTIVEEGEPGKGAKFVISIPYHLAID
jgi:signal transduction histidine kinase